MSNHEISKLHACSMDRMTFVGLWNNWVHLGETLRTENLLSREAKWWGSRSGQMSIGNECRVAEHLCSPRHWARHWGRSNLLPLPRHRGGNCTNFCNEWATLSGDRLRCCQKQARVCRGKRVCKGSFIPAWLCHLQTFSTQRIKRHGGSWALKGLINT